MGKKQRMEHIKSSQKKKSFQRLLIIGIIVILFVVAGIAVFSGNEKHTYTELRSDRPSVGNPDATVVVTEFSDLQCPACAQAHPIVKTLVEEYSDRVLFEYRHFPLRTIHPFAFQAASASECAFDQGYFWEYIDVIFSSQSDLSQTRLISLAGDLGLDTEQFTSCLKSGAKEDNVRSDESRALSLSLPGTPSFLINGKRVEQFSYAALKQAIETELSFNAQVE